MGLLVRSVPYSAKEEGTSDEHIWLFQEHTFGRSPQCSTVLDRSAVSRFHARLSWNGLKWTVRDLASRNGTYLNGRRLAEGKSVETSVGDRILFGDMHVEYRLAEADGPCSMLLARDEGGEETRIQLTSLVTLPSPDQPLCTILCGRGHEYSLEWDGGGIERLDHGQTFFVDGIGYTVVLGFQPDQSPQTVSSDVASVGEEIEIRVSPDEESAEIVLRTGAERQVFAPKVHFYLLAHLARIRQACADASVEGEATDDGWVDCETICGELRINREHLAQQVFRIRQELKSASPELAERVVDRRLRGRMRFGLPASQFRVRSMA